MKRLDMHYWRAGYSESCTVSSVGGRRKRAKPLVPRRRPTRLKQTLSFQAEGESTFREIGTRVKRLGREWKGQGSWSEKGEPMQGTGWVRWERGYEEPICVVSDLPLGQAKTAWYQLRFWIEDEYKDGKRGWFH